MSKKIKILGIAFILLVTVSWAYAQGGGAELKLEPSVTEAVNGDEIVVKIKLKNPGRQNIVSVRTWLTYDPIALEAVSLDPNSEDFSLSAPGEDNISSGEGRAKIGRSNITGGVNSPEVEIASVRFRVLAEYDTDTSISFYDYQLSELGHTSVNIIEDGFPANILSKAPDSIVISLNSGVAPRISEPEPEPLVISEPEPAPEPVDIGGTSETIVPAYLERPFDLKANTGSGYADLKWTAPSDPNRTGFNIYYGRASGEYSRRRTVGDFGNYRMEGLNNGDTYYFAVTAYDPANNESDYSNEVGIIVNEPLSSTDPFQSLLDRLKAGIPAQPQNGPIAFWLLASSAGLAGAVLFRRKKIKSKDARSYVSSSI